MKGKKVNFLRNKFKPQEIHVFLEELVFDCEREILERAVLLKWVSQLLKWVSWYHSVAMSPEVTVDQLIDKMGGSRAELQVD